MADEDLEDKTEEASEHRRAEWKKEGRVSQSKELTSAVLLLAVLLCLYSFSTWSLRGMHSVFEASLGELRNYALKDWSITTVSSITYFALKSFLLIILPVGVCSFVIAILITLAQTGLIWSTKSLEPNLEKINMVKGMGRIFSINGVFELLKSVLKLSVALGALYYFFSGLMSEIPNIWALNVFGLFKFLGPQLISLLFVVALAMFVISMIDYGYQKFQFERKLKMTKQEARDERKQLEGDPAIKARIRALQRQVANRKMMDAVKTADVVITNPTHIAIAIIFDRENMMAPKVVAKGADHMAERIKQIARDNGVPCVENVPLARALFKALKVGQLISREFYNAVAEVLAYVYRIKGKVN
jgi:flagellar biosynthesis protein FlhB